MSATPQISIVVLNHDGREHLGPCLGSLARDGWPASDVEVVVVDNGSRDDSASFVAREHPRVRWLPTDRNLGFTGGIAWAVERTAAPFLVFLNNDTWVHRGWLDRLVATLAVAPPEVAAVTGRITSWDALRIDYRDTLLAFDGHAFQLDFGRPLDGVVDDVPGSERLAPCGGNMAIRREAYLETGGFDPSFFAYLEDVDLGLRLRALGRTILYEPRATISHRSGATGTALGIFNRGFLIEKNAFAVAYKNFDDEYLEAWLPAILLAFLHRTERIARERGHGGGTLARDPYGEAPLPPPPRRGKRRRLLEWIERLLGVASDRCEDLGFAADPHTLSQLRALHRIVADLPGLETKRREIAASRRVASREIFERWPLAIVPTYPGDEELFSSEAFEQWLPASLPFRRLRLDEVGVYG